jgi:hypothetical protein
MCDVRACFRPGAYLIEGGHIVCEKHGQRFDKYICKYCRVQMIGKNNHSAILGLEHKPDCPRRPKES